MATDTNRTDQRIVLVRGGAGAGTGANPPSKWCVTNDATLVTLLRQRDNYRDASGPELEALRANDPTFAQVYGGIYAQGTRSGHATGASSSHEARAPAGDVSR